MKVGMRSDVLMRRELLPGMTQRFQTTSPISDQRNFINLHLFYSLESNQIISHIHSHMHAVIMPHIWDCDAFVCLYF